MAKGHHINHRHRSESLHQLKKARRRQNVHRTSANIPPQAIDEGAHDPHCQQLKPNYSGLQGGNWLAGFSLKT